MLYVVCGYPAAGKSTYCRMVVMNDPDAIVFDMDAMRAAMTGRSDPHAERMTRSIGRMLNDTAHRIEATFTEYGIRDLYLIRMVPTDDEMIDYIQRDDVRVLLLNTPKEVCLARAQQRGDFDLYAFGKACGRVDRFRRTFPGEFVEVSPLSLPLVFEVRRAGQLEHFPTTRMWETF